jgi:hypothetical protein
LKIKALFGLMIATAVYAADKMPDMFYIYSDKGSPSNHYIPSGWMGDYGDIKIDDRDTKDPADGKTDIKISYSGKVTQGANWAGIYWQNPANNWGTKDGGYNLTKYTKLTFWARGTTGKEKIQTVKVGGITGDFSDSDAREMDGALELTTEWKKYTVDLKGSDLKKIIGGFCLSWSHDDNPDGFVIYLDEIRFEK